MVVNYLALLVALLLSAVAAYYSIVGLAVIFASAMVPVVVMASTLEAGKVVAASWLYRNWNTSPRFIKYYLTVAVFILMLITSMGIFGFLSKAHLEQAVATGEVGSKLAIYDEKIKASKENIDASRKALKQMDDAVDQVMGRSTDEKGADKAVAVRRSQQKERSRLLSDIETEQKTVSRLVEESAPIRQEVRKVEAEVGPIKYIAALAYGDNPDTNMLESAVRAVIILLVSVFDPLAIIMLLAASHSIAQHNKIEEVESSAPVKKSRVQEPEPVVDSMPDPIDKKRTIKSKRTKLPDLDFIETPLPPEPAPVEEKEGWSPRWWRRAGQLIDRKKSGIIEIDKQSIVNMK